MVKSNVQGRRNYVIYCRSNFAKLYNYGEAKNSGVLRARIYDIVNDNIHWYEYTYKEDALQALEELKQEGYNVMKWEK